MLSQLQRLARPVLALAQASRETQQKRFLNIHEYQARDSCISYISLRFMLRF
jgi:hypothetical protein